MKYKPSKKIKKIKKQEVPKIKELMVLGIVIMIVMTVIIALDSEEILPHKPITTAGYHVFQDVMLMCWILTGIGVVVVAMITSFINKLDVQRHKESLVEIQALESRIDYLEDRVQVAITNENNLQDWIRNHDDDLKK